jgi:hypothetical protein
MLSDRETVAASGLWRICEQWCRAERQGSPIEGEYIEYLERLRGLADLLIEYQVSLCRALDGASWGEVARDIGVTRQAATKRFRHVDDWPPLDWEDFVDSGYAIIPVARRRGRHLTKR